MERTAKLFKKGQNQVVMLPAEFAFDTEGNVVLAAKPVLIKSWDNFLRMLAETNVPDTFLSKEERNQSVTTRDPLDGACS